MCQNKTCSSKDDGGGVSALDEVGLVGGGSVDRGGRGGLAAAAEHGIRTAE